MVRIVVILASWLSLASVLSFYFVEESESLLIRMDDIEPVVFLFGSVSHRQGPVIFHPTHLLCAFISIVKNGMANPITNVDDRP